MAKYLPALVTSILLDVSPVFHFTGAVEYEYRITELPSQSFVGLVKDPL